MHNETGKMHLEAMAKTEKNSFGGGGYKIFLILPPFLFNYLLE
jgi:hypothetical protein